MQNKKFSPFFPVLYMEIKEPVTDTGCTYIAFFPAGRDKRQCNDQLLLETFGV